MKGLLRSMEARLVARAPALLVVLLGSVGGILFVLARRSTMQAPELLFWPVIGLSVLTAHDTVGGRPRAARCSCGSRSRCGPRS